MVPKIGLMTQIVLFCRQVVDFRDWQGGVLHTCGDGRWVRATTVSDSPHKLCKFPANTDLLESHQSPSLVHFTCLPAAPSFDLICSLYLTGFLKLFSCFFILFCYIHSNFLMNAHLFVLSFFLQFLYLSFYYNLLFFSTNFGTYYFISAFPYIIFFG